METKAAKATKAPNNPSPNTGSDSDSAPSPNPTPVILTADTVTSLTKVESFTAAQLFDGTIIDSILATITAECRAVPVDISTEKGRKACASLAYKLARAKTFIEDRRLELVTDGKRKLAAIDAEGRRVKGYLEALQAEVRAPLTSWENAEKARVAGHEMTITHLIALRTWETTPVLEEVDGRLEEARRINTTPAGMQEFSERASREQAITVKALTGRHDDLVEDERARAELARLQAEVADRDRVANEERIAREARELAEASAAQAVELARIATQQAEQQALEAEQAAELERAAAAEREQVLQDELARAREAQEEQEMLAEIARLEHEEEERAEAAALAELRVVHERIRDNARTLANGIVHGDGSGSDGGDGGDGNVIERTTKALEATRALKDEITLARTHALLNKPDDLSHSEGFRHQYQEITGATLDILTAHIRTYETSLAAATARRKREANKRHVAAVNEAAAKALVVFMDGPAHTSIARAGAIIKAIADGKIPAVRIEY
jgi:hypothetical protein